VTVSVLIIGCGNIAGGYDRDDDPIIRSHAKAYRNHGGFALSACVDPDPERRAAFARRWNVARHYGSLDEIADRHFDVVSVCSPTATHGDHLRQLLDWPIKLVFCEKPLSLVVTEARSIVDAYDRAGKALAVNYQRRWDRDVQRMQSEDWGPLLVANGLYTKGLFNNGSHLIDLAQAILGPLRAQTVTDVVDDYEANDPTVSALLRTMSDAPFHMSAADCRHFTILELDMVFAKGRVTIGDSGFRWCRRRVVDDPRYHGYRILEPPKWRASSLEQALGNAVTNLHDFVTGGRPIMSSGRTALATYEICAELSGLAARR
jgi:predicted dehydrogenase